MVNCLGEALRTDEEGARGSMDGVKRAGVLNLGNDYFPHAFFPFRVISVVIGNSSRSIVPARLSLAVNDSLLEET
jgi:hypothetical protein